jgi:hypothetical protein
VPADLQAALEPALQTEVDRLQQGLPDLKLVLLNTTDPLYRGYVTAGLLHLAPADYEHLDSGLASTTVTQGKVNGQVQPVCYILYRPERAGYLYRAYIAPITAVASLQSAAAFLIGHETGHCLDHLQREAQIGSKMVWATADVAPLGLAPIAAARVFGPQMASGAYPAHQLDLSKDNAQRQYEERVADAFGVLWVWRLGGSAAVREAVLAARAPLPAWDAHATGPALQALDGVKEALAQTQGVADIWQIARQVQRSTGVDASLGEGSTHALNPLAAYMTPGNDPAKAGTAALPAQPIPVAPSRSFDALPRFGAPPLE